MADLYISKKAALEAAIIAGNRPEMDEAAAATLRTAKTIAIRNRLTGDYLRSLGTAKVRGESGTGTLVNDRVIYTTDEGALSIEYGHMVRYKNQRRVRWVPGQHILQRTMKSVAL
ncbi:DUF5403 family protein [Microbacterium sp. YY-01]|uniref:DUF5403 family protein n=1 Tax=Microbacterium sp. YY-01 TaxID=3421634 RepID=UPI003D177AC4